MVTTAKKRYMDGATFGNEIALKLFPELASLRGIRRILIDAEVGNALTVTVELIGPHVDADGELPVLRKQYRLEEIEGEGP